MIDETDEDGTDEIAFLPSKDDQDIRAITWDIVKQETSSDELMRDLCVLINSSFPDEKHELPPELLPYWNTRNNLYIVDGVILMKDQVVIPKSLRSDVTEAFSNGPGARILIPPNLRQEIIQSLHSAHQGVCGMNERAKAGVYWPGITKDIEAVRAACRSCNRSMPSQPRTPPVEPLIPSTPFEAVACDYFKFEGYYYFVAADRLSGWLEVNQTRVGTNESGSKGLCKALRRLMIQVGVPKEISSDGGPEFIAGETESLFSRWGIHHRISSAYYPSSNGRAELAVKTAKRLLMDNVGANGSLDNDATVRALLTYHNTPDPGCKLSPAQILLGRQLRDTLPFISRDVMVFNNSEVHPQWREAWKAKEEALKARYVKTMENLSEHSRQLVTLQHGDRVMIQNQNGRFPKKWDKSGVVVEVRSNDQYTVKVDGSGRLTLRNRQFLRKYDSHKLVPELGRIYTRSGPTIDPPASSYSEEVHAPSEQQPLNPQRVVLDPSDSEDNGMATSDLPNYSKVVQQPLSTGTESSPAKSTNVVPPALGPGKSLRTAAVCPSPVHPAAASHAAARPAPARPTPGVSPRRVMDNTSPSEAGLNGTGRSKRVRFQRQLYDASSGQYSMPKAVSEDI